MRIPRLFARLGLALLACAGAARAAVPVGPGGWAVSVEFPLAPTQDEFRHKTDTGDEVTYRYSAEDQGRRFFLAKFSYPIAKLLKDQDATYREAIAQITKSRPGNLRIARPMSVGDHMGVRLVIDQLREKTVREVHLVLIGASLYVVSAEWPAGPDVPDCARFLESLRVRPEYADPRTAEAKERWRELAAGNFRLRYDATRWYRDPTDNEVGVFNLLRTDKLAEAQFIAEPEPLHAATMEETVLATARENSESVNVQHTGRKLRGAAEVLDLSFSARAEGVTYINHGYFYTGPAGAVQLRSWSPDKTYDQVEGDITELLDGLTISLPDGATR